MPLDHVARLARKRFDESIAGEAAEFLVVTASAVLELELGDGEGEFSYDELIVVSDMLVSGKEDLFEVHWGRGETHALDLLMDLVKIWRIFIPSARSLIDKRDFNTLAMQQVETGASELSAQLLEGKSLSDVLTDKYLSVYLEKARLVAELYDIVEEEAPSVS